MVPLVTGSTHLLSILAGVSLADLAARSRPAHVRILPNLAAPRRGVTPANAERRS